MARIRRACRHSIERSHDLDRLFNQRCIARCRDTAFNIQIILQSDPNMTAQQNRLRYHGKLLGPDPKSGLDAVLGQ